VRCRTRVRQRVRLAAPKMFEVKRVEFIRQHDQVAASPPCAAPNGMTRFDTPSTRSERRPARGPVAIAATAATAGRTALPN